MSRPRSGLNLKGVPLNLDRDLMDKFEETLPRKKSVSEAIREYMQSCVDENDKQKKAIAPDNGAIKLPRDSNNIYTNNLDKYLPHWIQDYTNYQERDKILNALSDKKITELAIAINRTNKAIAQRINQK